MNSPLHSYSYLWYVLISKNTQFETFNPETWLPSRLSTGPLINKTNIKCARLLSTQNEILRKQRQIVRDDKSSISVEMTVR